jgi:hypothetical protein
MFWATLSGKFHPCPPNILKISTGLMLQMRDCEDEEVAGAMRRRLQGFTAMGGY